MVPRPHLVSWLFPTILCLALSTVYFFEWRGSRAEQRQATVAFVETVKTINNKLAYESTQTRSSLKAIGEGLESLLKRFEDVAARAVETATPVEPASAPEEASQVALEGNGADPVPEEDLPELPTDLNVRATFDSLNLAEFFSNPLFNPSGKDLSRAELLTAGNLLARAQARVMVLRSDIQLLVGTEMDAMREEGLYVDYERGQRMISEPGAYTSAERLEGGGRRLYSFLPEKYPKLHEMRAELRRIPEETVRRLMAQASK